MSGMMAWPAWLIISSIVAALAIYFYISGHVLKVDSIHPFTLSYSRYIHSAHDKLYSISASSPLLKLHIPKPRDPHWAKLVIQNYQYRDGRCGVSIATIHITFWFFPVVFRFTGGPLLTLRFDDFRLHVYNSALTPQWLRMARDNLVYTILNEEIICINRLKSRTSLKELMGLEPSKTRYDVLRENLDEESGERLLDQIKLYGQVEQCSIRNKQNNRMYTFNFEMEHRKSVMGDKATFKMIIRESKWVKLPLIGHFRGVTMWRYLIQTAFQFPKQFLGILQDPLLLVDVNVGSCYVTYSNFNLLDSALVEQGGSLIRDKYKHSKNYGLLSNASIDSFVQTIISLYDRDS